MFSKSFNHFYFLFFFYFFFEVRSQNLFQNLSVYIKIKSCNHVSKRMGQVIQQEYKWYNTNTIANIETTVIHKIHIVIINWSKLIFWETCIFYFAGFPELATHVRRNTGIASSGGLWFNQVDRLNQDLSIHGLQSAHSQTQRFQKAKKTADCNICGKLCDNTTNLAYHMNKHTRQKPYMCGYCGKMFSDRRNMKRHEKVHHGNVPKTTQNQPHQIQPKPLWLQ